MAALAKGPVDEITVESVTVRGTDGEPIPAIHARPDGMPVSGLVVHPDVGGLRPLFEDLAARLASHGLAVCVIEPFARAIASGVDLSDLEPRMAHVSRLVDELQLGDLEAAADYLVVNDDVTEVAVLGFCMGGMYALKAAGTERFDRAAAFYGMIRVPEHWRSPTVADPLDAAAGACPTIAVFGDADPFTPAADVDALRAAWSGRDDCEIVVYPGAEHGFVHDPERPAHRAEDAADAWRRVLTFLGVG
jgi:carboxymethylenebutenolidase